MKKYLTEVEQALKKSIKNDPDYKAFREKTTNLKVLGHRLPELQKITKEGFSFYQKKEDEILKVWDYIWHNTKIHEAMYLPLFYYRNHKTTLGKMEWNIIKKWVNKIENWEHSDALSCLYSHMHELNPKLIQPTLKKWNRSKDAWKLRASIVSLIYYASPKRKAPPVELILSMVKPLIGHKDKYVNKSVGWTLRESYKLYPKQTLRFIKKHIGDLSTNAFSYSTEKVDKKTKEELKKKRALARKK